MANVLSQSEIDLLLNSFAEGQIDTENIESIEANSRVRSYDFKRPNKFSKQHINSLRNIHENYCNIVKNYLTAHLHSEVSAKILLIEQITYDEFIVSLQNPTVLGVFSLKPLEGLLLLQIGSALSFTMIDRLLGGDGREYEETRDLTELEKSLIERRVGQMVDLFKEPWAEAFEACPELVALETNPQFAQILPANEMVALITIELLIGDVSGIMNICLPYLVLEPILEKMNTFSIFSTRVNHAATSPKLIKAKLEGVILEVVAILGHTEILVRDLLDLEPGDVIPLTQGVQEKLPISIGDSVKFFGTPGLNKEHLAIQVTEVFSEGGDDNE